MIAQAIVQRARSRRHQYRPGALGVSATATGRVHPPRGRKNNVEPQARPAGGNRSTNRVLLKGLSKENFRRGVPCAVVLLWKTP